VSVAVGPVARSAAWWQTWAEAADRSVVALTRPSPPALAERWVQQLLADEDLATGCLTRLADECGWSWDETVHRLSRATLHEREVLLDRCGWEESGSGPGAVCRRLVLRPDPLAPWPRDDPWFPLGFSAPFSHEDLGRCLGPFLKLAPPGSTPTVWVALEDAAEPEIASWTNLLVGWTTACPVATVGLAASEARFARYLAEAPETFSKGLLREGVVRIPTELPAPPNAEPNGLRQKISEKFGSAADRWTEALEQLQAVRASPELLASFVEVIESAPPAGPRGCEPSAQDDDGARSTAERFLWQLCEQSPDLAGLFVLNVRPGFLFGRRKLEIDLACVDLRIALEVDGYYHFRNEDCYRRDRRKDWELQQHGYLVLRFLAEDVGPRNDDILKTIRAAVRLRRSTSDMPPVSPALPQERPR